MSANTQNNLTSQTIITKLKSGTNIFLTGGAGTGKTFNTNLIKESFKNPIIVAPTGIAAAHLRGETIHSFFGFPVDKEAGLKALKGEIKELLTEVYRKHDLLIIDEISMVGDYLLNWIGIRFAELGVSMPILVVGDFHQLPPVSRDGDVKYAFESHFWREQAFETIELTDVHRTTNEEFSNILNELRVGKISTRATKLLDKLSQNSNSDDYTHLYSTNNKAFDHNKRMLAKIKNKPYFYNLEDEFLGDTDSERKEFEFKKSILKSRFENRLYLKEDALVMYTINKKLSNIYNGKKGIVTKLDDNLIKIDGKIVERELVEIYTYKKTTKNGVTTVENKLIGRVQQYPLKPAYAITIHKSQGMSIDGLSVDLSYIFASGQAYVALSRAMNVENTTVNLGYKEADKIFYTDGDVAAFYRKE